MPIPSLLGANVCRIGGTARQKGVGRAGYTKTIAKNFVGIYVKPNPTTGISLATIVATCRRRNVHGLLMDAAPSNACWHAGSEGQETGCTGILDV